MHMNSYVAIALWSGDKVLMQLRDNNPNIYEPNKWNLPGGKMEGSESSVEAIKREFVEETGYVLRDPKLVSKLRMNYDQLEFDWYIFSEDYDGKQEIGCFEGQQMKFLSKDELATKDISWKNLEAVDLISKKRGLD